MASGTAAGSTQHQLLPGRVHRGTRTEPAGIDISDSGFREADLHSMAATRRLCESGR
jgi:hypothetical protein